MGTLITDLGPWVMLALLGAYHGINPGMGWLFAVALGLQEQNRKAVLRAFVPIALGHAASIAAVVGLVAALQTVVSPSLLRTVGAGLLIAYGFYKLVAPMSHPRWVGMRVGFRDLAAWSFLMATAHGAGLMLVPLLLKLPPPPAAAVTTTASASAPASKLRTAAANATPALSCHTAVAAAAAPATTEASEGHAAAPVLAQLGAIALHTGAMFLTMALIAVAVYEKVGLAILRRAWFNLDLLWAIALVGAGVLTLFL